MAAFILQSQSLAVVTELHLIHEGLKYLLSLQKMFCQPLKQINETYKIKYHKDLFKSFLFFHVFVIIYLLDCFLHYISKYCESRDTLSHHYVPGPKTLPEHRCSVSVYQISALLGRKRSSLYSTGQWPVSTSFADFMISLETQ